jgi:phosphoribosylformylglycinamidine synthase
MIAVAEACRNVSCTGAEPVALTDCLNFGNPERPEIYYQLEECIKGMALASQALGAPVVSGNVSLYNETRGEGIYPTPVIGALGLLDDVEKHATQAFGEPDDTVVLIGASRVAGEAATLAGSEYLELVHGTVAGRPRIDLDREKAVQSACRRAIRDGVLKSAHDCSDGGLAVALAECCIAGRVGFRGTFAVSGRWDALLFGEEQSRIVVSLRPDRLLALERICRKEGAPLTVLGSVGGDSLSVPGLLDLRVDEMAEVWKGALELAAGGRSA